MATSLVKRRRRRVAPLAETNAAWQTMFLTSK
jgi:hypothetical protein